MPYCLDALLPDLCLIKQAATLPEAVSARGSQRKKVAARSDFGKHRISARPSVNMPSTYKREKPWDTDDIDKWAVCL